jgi:PhnB protein
MSDARLNPYLNFDGRSKEAMEFYQKAFGGELVVQTFGDSPVETPDEQKDRVMHAQLEADAIVIMASDTQPGDPVAVGSNVNLSLVGTDGAALTKIFDALAEGGEVTLPLSEQFWGDTFGMLNDRFGIKWMVNVSKA